MLAVARGLRHSLNARRHEHPGVHSLFVDRERWRRELRVSERSDWNGDGVVKALQHVIDRGATLWAELEGDTSSFVSDSDELLARTFDRDRAGGKPGLGPKDTSGSALAGEAVTDRDPNRVGCDVNLELATATRSGAMGHRQITAVTATPNKTKLTDPPPRTDTRKKARTGGSG